MAIFCHEPFAWENRSTDVYWCIMLSNWLWRSSSAENAFWLHFKHISSHPMSIRRDSSPISWTCFSPIAFFLCLWLSSQISCFGVSVDSDSWISFLSDKIDNQVHCSKFWPWVPFPFPFFFKERGHSIVVIFLRVVLIYCAEPSVNQAQFVLPWSTLHEVICASWERRGNVIGKWPVGICIYATYLSSEIDWAQSHKLT